MRIQRLSVLFLAAVLLGGCAKDKFTTYQGSEVIQGTGTGALRIIDGIDFWEYGDPDRKYKIVGTIDLSHKPGLLSMTWDNGYNEGSDAAIARAAHQQGGDAVIFVGGEPPNRTAEQVRTDIDDHGQNRKLAKLVLIKYVE
jgi:hypothetical protein